MSREQPISLAWKCPTPGCTRVVGPPGSGLCLGCQTARTEGWTAGAEAMREAAWRLVTERSVQARRDEERNRADWEAEGSCTQAGDDSEQAMWRNQDQQRLLNEQAVAIRALPLPPYQDTKR